MAEFPDSVGLGAGTSSMLENGDAVGLPGYALGRGVSSKRPQWKKTAVEKGYGDKDYSI